MDAEESPFPTHRQTSLVAVLALAWLANSAAAGFLAGVGAASGDGFFDDAPLSDDWALVPIPTFASKITSTQTCSAFKPFMTLPPQNPKVRFRRYPNRGGPTK